MLLANRVAFSSKDVILHSLHKQNKSQMLQPINYSIICKRIDLKDLQNTKFEKQLSRSIHVTKVNKDLEAGLRAVGAGLAATGVMGSGIGIGIIFGNFVSAAARNPSVQGALMGPAIMGAAFCESLGLFALIIGFLVQP